MRESQDFLLGNLHQIGRGLCVVTTEFGERLSELFDPSLEGSVLHDVGVVPGMRSRGDLAREGREERRVQQTGRDARSSRSASDTVTMSIAFRS